MTVALFKWTVDKYHAAIDAGVFDDQAVELLRGDIVVMAPEREPHACYSSIGAEYFDGVSENGLPFVRASPSPYPITLNQSPMSPLCVRL